MYFASKIVLWSLLPLAAVLLLLFAAAWRFRRRRLERFVDPALIPRLVDPATFVLRRWKEIGLFVVLLLAGLSLARPQWGQKVEQASRRGLDIIVAIDTSASMIAEDFKPNRLEKARHELATIIDALKGDRIGIVAFSGTAFLQCPLTLDYDAARMYLDLVDAGAIPVPGTSVAAAIRRSLKAFNDAGQPGGKVLVLISDGEDHEGAALDAAREARKQGVVVYAIGIGSTSGEPIPIRDVNGSLSGYKKDRKGSIVMSRLDDADLRQIAGITGGKYYDATESEDEVDRILLDLQKLDRRAVSSSRYSRFQDQFEWFLVPAAVLLFLEMIVPERRFSLRRRRDETA